MSCLVKSEFLSIRLGDAYSPPERIDTQTQTNEYKPDGWRGKKKEARLLGVWPLATERDGGLSGSRYSRGSCAEGDSTGRGKLVDSEVVSGLEKFGSLQTTLEVSVLRPIPIAPWEPFTIVCRAVNFTLQENELPITWFCQFRICLVHFRPSLLFLY